MAPTVVVGHAIDVVFFRHFPGNKQTAAEVTQSRADWPSQVEALRKQELYSFFAITTF